MDRPWKVVNLMFVVIPRFIIWVAILSLGGQILFETAGIMDMILNSMALNFILDFDELIYDRLADWRTKVMMEKLEPPELDVVEYDEANPADEAALKAFHHRFQWSDLFSDIMMVP